MNCFFRGETAFYTSLVQGCSAPGSAYCTPARQVQKYPKNPHQRPVGRTLTSDWLPTANAVWSNVMVLHMSGILSTGLGRGSLCNVTSCLTTWSHVPSRGSLYWRISVQGVYVQGGLCPGVSVWEISVPVKSGRYASYWNAFLFINSFIMVFYKKLVFVCLKLKNSHSQPL